MSSWKRLAAWQPVFLIILLASHTAAALVRHPKASFSLGAPEVVARAEEAATLEPYTGTGAVPTTKIWSLLSTQNSLQYSPTDSNITIRLTKKHSAAHNIIAPLIYNLTVLGLAKIASSVVTYDGSENFPHFGQENSTFATYDAPSHLQFVMTTSGSLPVYAVADVLRGMQELTHYLFFLEVTFEVFSETSPTTSPIASGYLAFARASLIGTVQSRDLELFNSSVANSSTANSSTDSSRQLFSSIAPIQLVTLGKAKHVFVNYEHVKDALAVYDQSFADVATGMLSNITNLVIANHGDGPLPSLPGKGRVLGSVDTWGSTLAISLLPTNRRGSDFTLGQAAMVLQAIQDNFSNGPMMESKLEITIDTEVIGWGCLTYKYQDLYIFLNHPPSWPANSAREFGTFYQSGHPNKNEASEDLVYCALIRRLRTLFNCETFSK